MSQAIKSAATEIRSDRLVMRPIGSEHCRGFVAGLNDWDVAKYLSRAPFPYTRADFEAFQAMQARQSLGGADFAFAIENTGSQTVGCIGLRRVDQDVFDLGFWIAKPYWGRGFATEAGETLLCWFKTRHPRGQIKASHFEDNDKSGRVLSKLGFVYTGETLLLACAARQTFVRSRAMLRAPSWEEQP